MRIIKFRAWIQGNDMQYDVDIMQGEPRVGGVRWVGGKLMQFTGLLDKNGKEIYEGDIIKTDFTTEGRGYSENRIEYIDGSFVCIDKNNYRNGYLGKKECEIIGNIYENEI